MLSVRYAGLTAANDAKSSSSRNAIDRNAKITTTGPPYLVLSRQSDDQACSMAPLAGEAFPNIPRTSALNSHPSVGPTLSSALQYGVHRIESLKTQVVGLVIVSISGKYGLSRQRMGEESDISARTPRLGSHWP